MVERDAHGGDAHPGHERAPPRVVGDARLSLDAADEESLAQHLADLVDEGGRAVDVRHEAGDSRQILGVEDGDRAGQVVQAGVGEVHVLGDERVQPVGRVALGGLVQREMREQLHRRYGQLRPARAPRLVKMLRCHRQRVARLATTREQPGDCPPVLHLAMIEFREAKT
jgi:hypothetical protein